jgi:hypothetical protein
MNEFVLPGAASPALREARGRFEHCPPSRHLYHRKRAVRNLMSGSTSGRHASLAQGVPPAKVLVKPGHWAFCMMPRLTSSSPTFLQKSSLPASSKK